MSIIFWGISIGCFSIDKNAHEQLIKRLQSEGSEPIEDSNSVENTHHIVLNGINSYIELPETTELLLNWEQSWSFSVLFPSIPRNGVLLKNGGNWVGLRIAEDGFTELWVTSSTQPLSASFYPIISEDINVSGPIRVTISFYNEEGSVGLFCLYFNTEVVFSYEDWAPMEQDDSEDTYAFLIGTGESEHIESYWNGGLDQAVFGQFALTVLDIEELMMVEDYQFISFYEQLTSWWSLGEDEYPNVIDQKGSYSGVLINGRAGDFASN